MSSFRVVVASITVHEGLFDLGGNPTGRDWFLLLLAPQDVKAWTAAHPDFRALLRAIEVAHPNGPTELWTNPTFLLRRHGDTPPFREGATVELSVSRTAWNSAELPERLYVDAWGPA